MREVGGEEGVDNSYFLIYLCEIIKNFLIIYVYFLKHCQIQAKAIETFHLLLSMALEKTKIFNNVKYYHEHG